VNRDAALDRERNALFDVNGTINWHWAINGNRAIHRNRHRDPLLDIDRTINWYGAINGNRTIHGNRYRDPLFNIDGTINWHRAVNWNRTIDGYRDIAVDVDGAIHRNGNAALDVDRAVYGHLTGDVDGPVDRAVHVDRTINEDLFFYNAFNDLRRCGLINRLLDVLISRGLHILRGLRRVGL